MDENLAWYLNALARATGAVPPTGHPAPQRRHGRETTDHAGHLPSHQLVGTPERCAARLAELAARTGIEHYILLFEGLRERSRRLENLRRFAAEVLPLAARPA